MTNLQKSLLSFKTAAPFLWVATLWLVLSFFLCCFLGSKEGTVTLTLLWLIDIWALCLVDLFSMAKFSAVMVGVRSGAEQMTLRMWARLAYWGTIKLICLGLFAIVLLKGQAIPSIGLWAGLGTLMIVPVFGGLWWSQREFSHA